MKSKASVWYEYLAELQGELKEANKDFNAERNENNRALLNQLFVVAGGYITLCTALLVTDDLLHTFTLSHHAKFVLIGVVLLSLCSIFCGIAQIFIDDSFLQRRKTVNDLIIEAIENGKVKGPKRLRALLTKQKEVGERSGRSWMWTQFGCLLLGGLGIVLLAIYLLCIAKITP